MARSIALWFVFLCSLVSSAAQTSTISGKITDSEGAALANARVLIHWDSSGSTVGLKDNVGIKQDVALVTDTNGQYSADVPPGFDDLFVSAMAFTPTAAKVRVKEGKTTILSRRLKVDPLVSKELD